MSNIYILEPPTSGKVLLKTSVGDIDIELWSKETPKTCRNFIQLCMEGYYNSTIFHRVVKDFIVQGGDPNGDGTGGESIYDEPFKDEFHQRLRFVRRGLVAMANAGKDDNGSQFFFTLAPTQELQNKHTIFGKVTGETLFNMLKLGEGLMEGEQPVYPHKIIKTEILNNPFSDIIPRIKESTKLEKKKKIKTPGVKNFKLLSFGQEAEEDEEETTTESKKFAGKSKSTHDVLDDPKLSSRTANVEENLEEDTGPNPEEQLENIRKKLKTDHKKTVPKKPDFSDDKGDDVEKIWKSYLHEEKDKEKEKKREEIRKEMESVKREYQKNKLQKEQEAVAEKEEQLKKSKNLEEYSNEYNRYREKEEQLKKSKNLEEYSNEYNRYREKETAFPKKGAGREQFTLSLLNKFKQKLISAKEKDKETEENENATTSVEEEVDEGESWMTHELRFKDGEPILAKDANTKGDDWFEIYDPRNPLNKRRRGEAIPKVNNK